MTYNPKIENIRAALNNNNILNIEDETDLIEDRDKLTKAAVLIAITNQENPNVILTQRPQWLRSHAGQVAFPGGKMDAADENICATALREAEEELSISPQSVDIVAQCPEYCSGSGYRITPIVAVIPAGLDILPNPDEVESWFETPIDYLFDRQKMHKKSAIWNGQKRSYYDMQWNEYRIWGVTAGIIANLARAIEHHNDR